MGCGDCGNCCVGNCSDCGGKAARELKERHDRAVANELASKRNLIDKNAKKLEEDLLNYLSGAIDNLVLIVKRQNHVRYGNKELNINIDLLKREQEVAQREIVGFIGDKVSRRLVQTDPELSVILAEMDDGRRNRQFSAFVDRLYASAKDELKYKFQAVMLNEEKMICEEIRKRIAEIEQNMEYASKQYESIVALNVKDSKELETKQLEYKYQLDIYGLLLEQLKKN